jgi:hypothetical protein
MRKSITSTWISWTTLIAVCLALFVAFDGINKARRSVIAIIWLCEWAPSDPAHLNLGPFHDLLLKGLK